MLLGGLDGPLGAWNHGVGGEGGWARVARPRVHLQLEHGESPSLGSVGGRGGLVERTSVHLLGGEARRPFKMGNYEEACDYLKATVHCSPSDRAAG